MTEDIVRVTRRQPSKHVRKVVPKIVKPRRRRIKSPPKPRPNLMTILSQALSSVIV